jgi:hypothetical protein
MPQVQPDLFIIYIIIFIIIIAMFLASEPSPQVEQHDCRECHLALAKQRLDYHSRDWKIFSAVIVVVTVYAMIVCYN